MANVELGIERTLPSVLHFLQQEWGRFERERAEWQQERAQLLARVAFLEGQRRGEENFKHDLLRRIKMLEFALRRERAKGKGDESAEDKPATTAVAPPRREHKQRAQEGRILLLQHLAEIGYTDEVIHAQAQRLKGMMQAWPPTLTVPPPLSGPPLPPKDRDQYNDDDDEDDDDKDDDDKDDDGGDDDFSQSAPIRHIYQIMAADNDDDDDEPSEDFEEEVVSGSANIVSSHATAGNLVIQELSDAESIAAEQARERAQESAKQSESAAAAAAAAAATVNTSGEGDNEDPFAGVDESQLHKLVSAQFGGAGSKMMKRQGKSKKKKSNKKGAAAAGAAAAGEEAEEPSQHASIFSIFGTGDVSSKTEAPENSVALGELADLDVAGDFEATRRSTTSTADAPRMTWKPKVTYRSHLDAVRDVAFHPTQPLLVSASEDKTLKIWPLITTWKKHPPTDTEPLQTLRGHSRSVLSVSVSYSGEYCFSGSCDTSIRSWKFPGPETELYSSFTGPACLQTFVGHTDSVWSVDGHPSDDNVLLSASADGSCRFWNTSTSKARLIFANPANDGAVPTSAQFLRSDPTKMLASYSNAKTYLVDVEKQAVVLEFKSDANYDDTKRTQINVVRSHHTNKAVATAHADKQLKFFDISTGECTHEMVAHQDAVTGLDFDSQGLFVVTSGHDRSVRVWDYGSKNCVDEITTHRPKFDEAIHSVRFHPSDLIFASAGADSTTKIFL